MMSFDRRREKLREEVLGYTDRQLVQVAWDSFEAFRQSDFDDPAILKQLRKDIGAADRELIDAADRELAKKALLSAQARGSLRRFVLNKGIQDLNRHL